MGGAKRYLVYPALTSSLFLGGFKSFSRCFSSPLLRSAIRRIRYSNNVEFARISLGRSRGALVSHYADSPGYSISRRSEDRVKVWREREKDRDQLL